MESEPNNKADIAEQELHDRIAKLEAELASKTEAADTFHREFHAAADDRTRLEAELAAVTKHEHSDYVDVCVALTRAENENARLRAFLEYIHKMDGDGVWGTYALGVLDELRRAKEETDG